MDPLKSTVLISLLLAGWVCLAACQEPCLFGEGCLFSCHCASGTVCNATTGECPEGCDEGKSLSDSSDFNSGRWYGPACQIGNVAFKKYATQCNTNNMYSSADRAVDGGTLQQLLTGRSCAYPNGGYCPSCNPQPGDFCGTDCDYPEDGPCPQAWWQVDLGGLHYIFNVTILNRQDCCHERIFQTSIRVGNATLSPNSTEVTGYEECAFIAENDPDYLQENAKITKQCGKPLVGRYVTITRTGGAEPNILTLCEVYVEGVRIPIGCPPGTWGIGCLTACNCQTRCDHVTGHCPSQCTPGWTGEKCPQACPDGSWGLNCDQSCSCASKTEVCDKETGACPMSGCPDWQIGTACDKIIIPKSGISTQDSINVQFQQWENTLGTKPQVDYYSVQYHPRDQTGWTEGAKVQYSSSFETKSVTIEGLDPNTEYVIRVVPMYAGQTSRGPPSQEITAKTRDKEDPGNWFTQNTVLIVIILAVVIVVVILVFAILLAVLMKRRKQRLEQQKEEEEASRVVELTPTPNGAAAAAANS